jgi:hypothetical protein
MSEAWYKACKAGRLGGPVSRPTYITNYISVTLTVHIQGSYVKEKGFKKSRNPSEIRAALKVH